MLKLQSGSTYGESGLGLSQSISSFAAGDLEVGILLEGQGALGQMRILLGGGQGKDRGGQGEDDGELGEVHGDVCFVCSESVYKIKDL